MHARTAPPDAACKAARDWLQAALEAHTAFGRADIPESEYRARLRRLGMRRIEIDHEVGLHGPGGGDAA